MSACECKNPKPLGWAGSFRGPCKLHYARKRLGNETNTLVYDAGSWQFISITNGNINRQIHVPMCRLRGGLIKFTQVKFNFEYD